MDKKIIGAKKQANQSRAPVIAPDSAQSTTTVKILYGLSEGEIEGLADGLKSVYLDDTPVQDVNGNPNFDNVIVDFRAGTNDQDYIEGFPDVSNEININVELKETTPWVRAFSNTDLDAARVRLKWGALRVQDATTGNVDGITIRYAIDRQTDGGVWEEVINTQISDKTSPDYQRTHRIELPRADSGWQIRVRRITPNQNSDLVSDKMYVAAVTEVIDVKLRYPNTALLGLQYDAETFSNIAKMAARCKGVRIRVPTNYDPETRQYVGIWDGTFKYAYTNNPAWHFYDACIDKRRGLGNHLDQTMVDKWSIYRLGQYCDELVPDGKGGQEPRFTLNVYQQSQEDAYSVLGKMAGVMRAYMFWDGQSIVLDADMPSDTVYTFTRANVINGHFEFSGTRKRDRHTIAVVNFDNPDNRFKTEQEPIPDEEAIAKYGINKVEIDAWGVTSRGQAQRAGQWALKTEKYETQTVMFKVGLEGYIPQPGKVIEIADESFAGRANGGRISSISADLKQVTLDRDDVVCRAGDRLVINGEDGKAKARVIEGINGRVVTVVSAFEENTISSQNVWVIDAQDLATMKFRIVSIIQNDKHQFEIKAVQYNPQKYDAIDYGAYIDEIPITIVNPDMQPAVESVSLSTYDKIEQGMNIAVMVIGWPQAQGAVRYQIEWRKDDGSWIKMPLTGNNSVEIEGVYSGNYQARITAFSAFDIASLPTYSSVTALLGKNGTPPALANLTATGILFGIRLEWLFPAKGALDTAHTEIRVSPDGVSNISTLGLFAYPTTTHTIQGLQPNLKLYFQARLIDRLGNVGPWTEWINATTSADATAVLDLLNGQITESQLDQDLRKKIDKIPAIDDNIADIIQAVNNLEDGYTQERTERIAGDQQNLNQLNAYKLSNDSAVAGVVSNVNVLTGNQQTMSSKIDGVYAQVNPPMAGSTTDMAGDSTQYAGVWSEMSARIENDMAQSIRTDSVVAQINDNDAIYKSQIKATADANKALVEKTETIQTSLGENTASIKSTQESVNGLSAKATLQVAAGNTIGGVALGNNGGVVDFIVRANKFAIAPPEGTGGPSKYAFVYQSTAVTLPNGTVVPAGLYLDNASVGYISASKIYADSLSAISANLGTILVDNAHIKDGAVDTLKIQNEAVTVPVGVKYTQDYVVPYASQIRSTNTADFTQQLADWEAVLGTIATATLTRSGGKCLITASFLLDGNTSEAMLSTVYPGGNPGVSDYDRMQTRIVVSIYKGTTLVGRHMVAPSSLKDSAGINFNTTISVAGIIDDSNTTGSTTYTLKVGFAYVGTATNGVRIGRGWNNGLYFQNRTLTVTELKR